MPKEGLPAFIVDHINGLLCLGILRKEGNEVKPKQFMKISVPFMLAAVTSGYLLVWLIWA
jgi:Na+/H+ antiporter NhaD/arsenite permease-like protein